MKMTLGTLVGAFGVATALAVGSNALYVYGTAAETDFTVTGKDRIVETSNSGKRQDISSKYLVFTKNKDGVEVFENTDSLLNGKFNSSDVQAQLEIGKQYRAAVYGWRIPFFSSYRNIVEAKPLTP
jgi:hypothetical protein